MTFIFSESTAGYSTYTFPYCIYAVLDAAEPPDEAYQRGFLPYSADTSITKSIFYLAKSTRIDLNLFADTGEDRRIDRKNEALQISMQPFDKENFDLQDTTFLDFCLHFANERFSNDALTKERFQYILSQNYFNTILVFKSDTTQKIIGYVLLCESQQMAHYWYAFYDAQHLATSLGKWIMWHTIGWAKKQQKQHLYLGTCYSQSALYKSQFKGFEFWDGMNWNTNKDILKKMVKNNEAFEPDKINDLLKKRTALGVESIFLL